TSAGGRVPCVALQRRLREFRAERGGDAWAFEPEDRERGGARRGLPVTGRADVDDLRALQGWHQPQRDRGRASRAPRGGRQWRAVRDPRACRRLTGFPRVQL